MKTALVTGGAGFLGSHLCDRLIEDGFFVICLDNLVTGRLKNIKHLEEHPNFSYIRHDVSKPLELGDDVDYIFHLASPASPVDYQEVPIKTILANAMGAYHMLSFARMKGAKFLLASTSEIYGDPKEHPQKETYWGNVNPIGVRSCYDESKRVAEAITMSFVRAYGTDARIVRIFNTYGPRMREQDGRFISNFIFQALKGIPLTVYGDGMQTRSACFVSDMIDGICRAMFMPKTKGEVFNLGNPDEKTVLEVANIVKRLTKSKSEIIFMPLPKDDPARRRPDITKAREILGFEPKVSLEEGIGIMIEHFKKEMGENE